MTERDPDGPGPLPPQLVCGGYFASAGGVAAAAIASWDPVTATWSPLGSGMPRRRRQQRGVRVGDLAER